MGQKSYLVYDIAFSGELIGLGCDGRELNAFFYYFIKAFHNIILKLSDEVQV